MRQQNNRRDVLRAGAGVVAGELLGTLGFAAPAEAEEAAMQPKHKIRSVTTYLLRHQLKRPFGVSVSVPLSKTREALLVKIETEDGLAGWGETAPIAGARGTIVDQLAPLLIGRNPLEYRRLWRELWGANFGNGLAVGAVETALNDLRGKLLNLPLAELFGGRLRERVPVYVSALTYAEGGEIEAEYPRVAAEMKARGHRAIKMRLGRYAVAREAAVAAKVRETVGPEIKLMADGNGAYVMRTALEMSHRLHELGFDYFEEPLPQQTPHYTAYELLREKMPLPLAGGEGLDCRAAAKTLIDRRSVDILQPDISLCGGFGEVLFIAEMAALSGIHTMPHCWGGDILIAATAHLVSLLPDPHWGLPTDSPLMELDQTENPWRNGLAKQPLDVKDGAIAIPRKPGLGIEVNEDVVRHYAVATG